MMVSTGERPFPWVGWLDMEFGLPTSYGHLILFQNEHSPCGLERCSVEGVEIDAAGNRFADVVLPSQ